MKLLKESIQIMTRFAREIGYRNSLIVDFNFHKTGFSDTDPKHLTLLNSLFYMAVIDSYSYLAEYEQVFGIKTENEFNKRVIDVKTINKPLTNKIKEWKDLGNFRNQLLAHNLRQGKNGEFIFGLEKLDYNAPRTISDLFLLSNLIQFITQTFHLEFSPELSTATSDNIKDNLTTIKQMTKEEVSKITTELLTKATTEMRRLNKNYNFSFNGTIEWDRL